MGNHEDSGKTHIRAGRMGETAQGIMMPLTWGFVEILFNLQTDLNDSHRSGQLRVQGTMLR